MMAWNVRYTQQKTLVYQVAGGKPALILSMLVSVMIIVIAGYCLI
jgi:hypothetical protein